MKKKKAGPITKCDFKGCKIPRASRDRFCNFHKNKVTVSRFLSHQYSGMKERVEGRAVHDRGKWAGKPILPKDVFITWARNHPIFLNLYKKWAMSGFDRKLAPSVNRIVSKKGYTLDNMEWLTNSQNSGLSSAVRTFNQKKAIYNLLGVNANVKTN